jgi:hypothetical protein
MSHIKQPNLHSHYLSARLFSNIGNIGGEKTIMLRHKPTKSSFGDNIELKQQDIRAQALHLNQIMSCHPQHQNLALLYMVI